jgi:hydroxymethylbilane synthase
MEADHRLETVVIRTTGDRVTDRSLADIGGKGLFAKELEEALFDKRIDVAVHSAKDLPSFLPAGLMLSAVLPREDPRDAFLSRKYASVDVLPLGAVIGSSSVRRQALLLSHRPDLKMVLFRGNVDTRIAKLNAGEVDATILAVAGLNRLGRLKDATEILSTEFMLPAAGQGVIALEVRDDDVVTRAALRPINHQQSGLALAIERAFLGLLDGSCKTPIAALAEVDASGQFIFRGAVLSINGSQRFDTTRLARVGTLTEAEQLGADAGREILHHAGRNFLMAT